MAMRLRLRPDGAALAGAALLAVALLLLNRSVVRGEILSASDLLFSYPPWSDIYGARPPSNHEQSDETLLTRPVMLSHWARLKRAEFPAYDVSQLAGAPAFLQGLLIGRTLYPPALVYYFASPERADGLFALIQLWLAGVFMYAYCRRIGLRPLPCFGAAAAFMLNGYFVVWLLTPKLSVALWLPAGLLAAEQALDRPGARTSAMLALATAPMYLAGYIPNALIGLALISVYCATGAVRARLRPVAIFWPVLGILIGLATGVLGVLPASANLAHGELQQRLAGAQAYRLANLATFLFPEFWGTPVDRSWWAPQLNYSESVTYLGIVPLLLAPLGAIFSANWRRWFFAAVAGFVLGNVYGLPGLQAASALPVVRSVNNFRFVVALVLSASVLTGMGLDAISRSTPATRRRMLVVAVGAAMIWLGLYVVSVLSAEVPLHYRTTVQWGGLRGTAYLVAALALIGGAHFRVRAGAAAGLVALLLVDLTVAGMRFVTTVPAEMAYPSTPALQWLKAHQSEGRTAFVGDPPVGLLPGAVPSVYGLRSVGGYDFVPEERYQRFLGAATASGPVPARMGYVFFDPSLEPTSPILDLLHVRYIATPSDLDLYRHRPVIAPVTMSVPAGELLNGRLVGQSFLCPAPGLSQIDVYVATYRRINHGRLVFHLRLEGESADLVTREFSLETLRDNSRLSIAFAALPDSAGRRYRFWLESPEAQSGNAVTLWANGDDLYPHGNRFEGQQPVTGDLCFRAYVDRSDPNGLRLVYAGDLNIIENRDAQPSAWIVREVELADGAHAVARLASDVPVGTRAVVDRPIDLPRPASSSGASDRLTIDRPRPEALIASVALGTPGLLVLSEKFDPRWRATVDGQIRELLRVDEVLCGVLVPAGEHEVELMYDDVRVARSTIVSAAACFATLVMLILPRRDPDRAHG